MPSGVYPNTHKHEKARGLSRNKYDTKGNLRKARASRAKPPVYPKDAEGNTNRPIMGDLGANSGGHPWKIEKSRHTFIGGDGLEHTGYEREIRVFNHSTRKIRSDAGKPRNKKHSWTQSHGFADPNPLTEDEKTLAQIRDFSGNPYAYYSYDDDGSMGVLLDEDEEASLKRNMAIINYTGNRDRPKKPKKPPTGKYPKPPMPKRAPPKPPKPARPPMPKRAPPRVYKGKFKIKAKTKEEPKKEEPKKKKKKRIKFKVKPKVI